MKQRFVEMPVVPSAHNIVISRIESGMLPVLARLHLAAFDGYMNARLGPGYARAFLDWFRSFDCGIALTASLGGEPVGYVVGAPVGYQTALNRDLAAVVVRAVLARPWLVLAGDMRSALTRRIALRLGRALPPAAPDELPLPVFSLVAIGVSPAARGCGIGGSLVRAFERDAARLGARSIRLSVYKSNTAARRVYEQAGWSVVADAPGPVCYYGRVLGE